MSTWLRMAVVGLVVVAVGASSAAAQDKTCSEKDIARAQLLDVDAGALFDSRDFRAALENWKEAYTLCPNYITAWNIARSYEELLELNQAREAFLLYINAPGVPPEKAKLAQAKIETIAEQVEVWKSLFDSAQSDYDAGDYAKALSGFEAAAGTYAESQTLIRIADCHEQLGHTDDAITTLEDRVLALSSLSTVDRAAAERKLAELRTPELPDIPPGGEEVEGSNTGLVVAGWVLTGVGVASLATGGLLYASNASTLDDIENLDQELEFGNELVREERNELADDLESTNTLLWISYGVGAVALVSGATLLTLGYMGGSERQPAADEGATTQQTGLIFDGVTLTPGGAMLQGRF